MSKLAPSVIALLLSVQPILSQNDSLTFVFQDAIESAVSANDDNPFDFDTEFEQIQDYTIRPININTAQRHDFEQLRLLTTAQISDILNHREKHGKFIVLYELQAVLDLATIHKILPFVTCDGELTDYQVPVNQWFKRGKHTILTRYARRLENESSFFKSPSEGGYLGDANRLYMRHRYSFGNRLSYGFTLEKDAGERLQPDFYSFHFKISDLSKSLKTICLGDYSLSLGQGLIHHNGFNLGKSALVLGIEKDLPPLRQYTSANEANFMRGVAAHFNLGKNIPLLGGNRSAEAVIFSSYRRRDGNIITPITTDPTDDQAIISTLQFSGLHRTSSELADKNAVGLLTLGASIKKNTRRGHVAFNSVFNQFDKKIIPRAELYNLYAFKGERLLNISGDYQYTFQNFHAFGETALNDKGGLATLNGLLIGLDKKLSFSLLQRYISLKYQAINAQAFIESSRVNDESGLYFGFEYKPNRKWTVSSYADFWKYKWLKFRVDAPSQGHEFFTKINYRGRTTEGYIQVRFKTKQENIKRPDSLKINQLADKTRSQIRFNFQNKINRNWVLRNRLEWSFYEDETDASKGFVIWQDVIFHPPQLKYSFTSRLAFFDTKDYSSAIYGYENDLIYNFTVLPYYGQGTRFYLNFQYDFNKKITAECRFARTNFARKPNSQELDHLTDIKCQVRLVF